MRSTSPPTSPSTASSPSPPTTVRSSSTPLLPLSHRGIAGVAVLAEHGAATARPDRAPTWPQNYHDCQRAIQWCTTYCTPLCRDPAHLCAHGLVARRLREHAGEWRIDRDRIGAIGGSAGVRSIPSLCPKHCPVTELLAGAPGPYAGYRASRAGADRPGCCWPRPTGPCAAGVLRCEPVRAVRPEAGPAERGRTATRPLHVRPPRSAVLGTFLLVERTSTAGLTSSI